MKNKIYKICLAGMIFVIITDITTIYNNAFATSDYVITKAYKDQENARPNIPFIIRSTHYISVTNPTNKVYGFRCVYTLCATDRNCEERAFTKNLEPNQNYQERFNFERKVAYGQQGQKSVWAITKVDGDIKIHSDENQALNTIYVSN